MAYDERVLNDAGDVVLTEPFELARRPDLLQGDVRLVFFMHYLDPSRALRTPFGDLQLPHPSERPSRLARITYEAP